MAATSGCVNDGRPALLLTSSSSRYSGTTRSQPPVFLWIAASRACASSSTMPYSQSSKSGRTVELWLARVVRKDGSGEDSVVAGDSTVVAGAEKNSVT